MTPKGPDSPHWKHGERSKYRLPERLQAVYEAALADPDLASMKHELAALDAILADFASNLDGFDRQGIATLRDSQNEIQAAIAAGDDERLAAAVDAQGALLDAEATQMQRVFEFADLMEQRSRIAAREHRRMVQLDAMVRFDELLVRIGLMMEAVRQNVRDNAAIALIATEWQRILGPLPRGITNGSLTAQERGRSGDDDGSDAGDDADADLRAAFEGAMQRLAADSAPTPV
ncbi:hypothetical protein GC176_24680 [bacterium]|nr:hypothetical protein [bacterium]